MTGRAMERIAQDAHFALRLMRKSPGFTATAVLSLALGIGANTAIFTLMNALVLKRLPVSEPDRLVVLGRGRWVGIIDDFPNRSWDLFSYPFYRELQRKNQVFSGVAAMESLPNRVHGIVGGAGQAETIEVRLVSGTYFSVLGVSATAGRVFTDADDQTPGAHPVAVASYSWWERRFGRDPSAVGKTLAIGPASYTIVGIAPPGFFGTTVGESPDLWIPLAMMAKVPPGWGGEDGLSDPAMQSLNLIGRLKPGVSAVQARANVNVLFKQSLREWAGANPGRKRLEDIQRALIEITAGGAGLSQVRIQFSGALRLLMAAVGLVLLIACANIANLLLGRAAGRQREIAVRLAIGATRARLIRQMLTESVLLALVGGAAGLELAWWASSALRWMVSAGTQAVPLNTAPDARVLAFALLLSLATGLVFGAAPALRSTGDAGNSPLKEGRGGVASRRGGVLAKALVVSQVTLSVVLVTGAGLFIHSLTNLKTVDPGFSRDHVLVFQLDTDSIGYREDARLTGLYRDIEQRVSNVPGVRACSFSMFTFNQGSWWGPAFVGGGATPPESQREIHNNAVGPGFFDAMGMPVLIGRAFGSQDTASTPKVAVINETMARRFFPNQSPLGRRFGLDSADHGNDIQIVGVVKDAKYERMTESPQAAAYYPYSQAIRYLEDFEVRYSGDARAIIPEVRRAIEEVHRGLPVAEVSTLAEQVDRSFAAPRLIARLSGLFALVALLLASVGIYGVMSYAVSRRTSEIGVRMAMGARRSNVLWLVMRDSVSLVLIGLAIGVPAAAALGRTLTSMLFGLGALDPPSIATSVVMLVAVSGFAAYLPARRASRVDPIAALRHE